MTLTLSSERLIICLGLRDLFQRSHLMLEKIKYRLSDAEFIKRTRVRCIAAMTAVTIAVVTLLGFSLNTVKVFDGEKTYTVRSVSANVANILSGLKLKSEHYKIMNTKVENHLTTVEIAYSFPVFITAGENTLEIEFTGGTVHDALVAAGFAPDEDDFIEPAADTAVTDTVYIDYTDIKYVDGSYTEVIPHTLETVYSADKASGSETVEAGTDGEKRISYTEKIVNGVSSGRTVTAEEVVKSAVNGKKIIGTRKAAAKSTAAVDNSSFKGVSTLTPTLNIEFDKNGVPLKYKSKMVSRATAYTYTGHNCATGVAPQPGYIAVNPKVIPYGTKMYIRTADGSFIYGYAVAADTGGFVNSHPTGVDLFMSTRSACISFGVRNVEIYILE